MIKNFYVCLCICMILLLSSSRLSQSSIQQLNLSIVYEKNMTMGNMMERLKMKGNIIFVALGNGIIQATDYINNVSLHIYNHTLTFGYQVFSMQVIDDDMLFSIYSNRLIAVWNITTATLINFKYSSYTIIRSNYLKQKKLVMINICQQRGYELVDPYTLASFLLVYDASPFSWRSFRVSPNEQIIVDWGVFPTSIRIYNFTGSSLALIQQYTSTQIDYLQEKYSAIFSFDVKELILCMNNSLWFHKLENSFRPSKKIRFNSITQPMTSVQFLNEKQRIFLLEAKDNQTIIYDEKNNQTVSFTFLACDGGIISQNNRYVIRFGQTKITVLKIDCQSGYFYNNASALCRPCYVNNCSTCDSDNGQCLTCLQTNHYAKDGVCKPCKQYCLSCQGQTGNCIECQYPFFINEEMQCQLIGNMLFNILSKAVVIINMVKTHSASFLIMSLNQLELYNYHNRSYGNKTLFFLDPIDVIQLAKWQVLSELETDSAFASMRVFSSYNNYTDNIQFIQKTGYDFNFWNACFRFFVYLIPQALILYLILKFVFLLLFNYEISKYIRQYSFYLFLMPSIFSNNVEYLSFTVANKLQKMFYFSIWDKMGMLLFYLFLFVFVMFVVAFPFIVLIFHKRTKKYFFDECVPSLAGGVTANLFYSYQSFILSMIQSFLHHRYIVQMCSMIGVEFIVIIGLILLEKRFKCFEKKSIFSTFLINQCLMILFNVVLIADYYARENGDVQTMNVTDSIAGVLIICLFSNTLAYTISCFIPVENIRNKKSKLLKKKQVKKMKLVLDENLNTQQTENKHINQTQVMKWENCTDLSDSNKAVANLFIQHRIQVNRPLRKKKEILVQVRTDQ